MIGFKVMKRTRMCFERSDRAISIGRSPLCVGSLIICYMSFFNINAHFGSDYFVLISQHNLVGTLLYSHPPPICQGGNLLSSHFSAYPGKGEIFFRGEWLWWKNGSVAPAEHLIVDVVVDLEKRRYVKWSDLSTRELWFQ